MVAVELSGAAEEAAGGEVGCDARRQQKQAEGEGPDGPVALEMALEHEAIEQGQDQDQHGGFGEEGGAAMGGDRDQIEEGRGLPDWLGDRGLDR